MSNVDHCALLRKWREREGRLRRQADSRPSTPLAKTLANRAECYARCADELVSVMADAAQQEAQELEK